ncbi:ParA family protein [Bacillus toyonensis]|uniref:ParA family protein n=1 Tax=Bacillus toyonensis TaxID=155322 RepID=UPI001C92FAE3|nr:ParA family protein [Bacillus toyonensis]
MGQVISFINMKGGVGKTTLCIGVGEFLANYMDKKVLFIDVDPQFNTTQSLLNFFNLEDKYLEEYRHTMTIKKLFETPTTISEKPKLPEPKEVILNLNENIDLIPGTINLIFDENKKDGGKTRRLRKFINDYDLKNVYDFIFIDCPPTISFYTDAALIASDFYLVPNRVDRYSILGIQLLKQVIDRLVFDEELSIKPLGIVYTMVKDETHKVINLKRIFESEEIVGDIGLFSSQTSLVNDLMVGLQGNISSNYKKSREDIEDLSREFLERIEGEED